LAGFHSLHCIVSNQVLMQHLHSHLAQKLIKWSMDEFRNGTRQSQPQHHINHCLDVMLQDIKCHADDTPLPMMVDKATGDGQIRQCRSWDKLVEWATLPENTACYKQDDKKRDDRPSLESWAHCPQNSPYFETMNAYFKKWGHHPLPPLER
jgi:hypothetical protein